jgi:hypothetical protein
MFWESEFYLKMNYREVMDNIVRIINPFIRAFGIYGIWILLHYVSANLYVRLCAYPSFVGFIASPFLAASPHCSALRWAIYNGGNSITSMWVVMGVWLLSYIVPIPFPILSQQNKEN